MQLKDMTGKKVPQVTFHTRSGHEWVDVTTDDILKIKRSSFSLYLVLTHQLVLLHTYRVMKN